MQDINGKKTSKFLLKIHLRAFLGLYLIHKIRLNTCHSIGKKLKRYNENI